MGIDYFNCYECEDILNDCVGGYETCYRCERRVCDYCNKQYKILAKKDYYEDYGHLCCAYCMRKRPVKIMTRGLNEKQYKSIDELKAEVEW